MRAETCQGPECTRTALHGTYCDTHLRQIKRGMELRPIRPYTRRGDLRAYLLESAERYGRAGDDHEKSRAERDLMLAAKKMGKHLMQAHAAVAA